MSRRDLHWHGSNWQNVVAALNVARLVPSSSSNSEIVNRFQPKVIKVETKILILEFNDEHSDSPGLLWTM